MEDDAKRPPAAAGGASGATGDGARQTHERKAGATADDVGAAAEAAPMPPEGPEESLFEAPPLAEQERMVEAILFASAEPVKRAELEARLPRGSDPAAAIALLEKRYEGRGVRLMKIGDGWAFRTAPDLAFLMTRERREERRLSRAALETLAIIAYHQPVTRAEIEEIRGVSVSRGTIDLLMALGWIRFGRRRDTPGRPVTFVVTDAFLDHFGLESTKDLPGLKELRAAGLLERRPPPGGLPASGGNGDGEEDEEGPRLEGL